MQTRDKIILCSVGYVIAVSIWFLLAAQALTENQLKAQDLNSKKKEHTELTIKLSDYARQKKEQDTLEIDIAQLRGSVPKSPDIDILIIDLEKMCLDSGLEVISIEEPDKDKLRTIEPQEVAKPVVKPPSPPPPPANPPANAVPDKQADKTKAATPPPAPEKPKVPQEVETGLVKQYLLVNAQGSYAGTVELMRKLEAYQRVIGVNQIDVGFSSEGKEKTPDPKELRISFFLTAYYLP